MSGAPEDESHHEPVLLDEVLSFLRPGEGGLFIDCTVGLGGHTEAILEASPEAEVIGLDRDLESLQLARARLARFGRRFIDVQANFKELETVLDRLGAGQARGILADLGISSHQLDSQDRGFSFQTPAPLDMRMDRSQGGTGSDLLNSLSEADLADLIFQYGEERGARRIARAIVRERQRQPVTTTTQLAEIVVRVLKVPGRWRIHPATRTFQALRIAVNRELEGLAEFVSVAAGRLKPSGRLAVISFHSLEDGIIKRALRLASGQCQCEPRQRAILLRAYEQTDPAEERIRGTAIGNRAEVVVCDRCGARKQVTILTRKPIHPSEDEIKRNPRARSARLRVCERSD